MTQSVKEALRKQLGKDESDLADLALSLLDSTEIDESLLRRLGFDGPRFDEDRLQLVSGRFKFTKYGGWNLWRAIGHDKVQLWERLVDDVKTLGRLRMIAMIHGIQLKEIEPHAS